jgi:hypothetical protein
MRKLLLIPVLLLCVGCVTVPQATVTGAKLLKVGVNKLDKDYVEYHAALDKYILAPTEDGKKLLLKLVDRFDRGYKALKLAVHANADAIIMLAGGNRDE